MYKLVIETAAAPANIITVEAILSRILNTLQDWAVSLDLLESDPRFSKLYQKRVEVRDAIRRHKLNRPRRESL
jgi:hypothetical protein